MVYVKGVLFGIVALIVATIANIPVAAFVLIRRYPPPPGAVHVGVNVISLINRPAYWLISIAAFALGCYWQFRKAVG
jgi:hypothetical protein